MLSKCIFNYKFEKHMVIEITTKKIAVFFTIVILICGGFACGFYLGKRGTVPKEEYTTARQYAIYTSEMLKALHSDLGKPYISNVDFCTNARAIATLKAKATGKKYSETQGTSYTLEELLDVNSLLKEE